MKKGRERKRDKRRHPEISREKETIKAKRSRTGKGKRETITFFQGNRVKGNEFEMKALLQKEAGKELVSKIPKAFCVFVRG